MKAHRTKILSYVVNGSAVDIYKALGVPYNHSKHPSYIEETYSLNKQEYRI